MLRFYEGWAQDPVAQPAVNGGTTGASFRVAYRLKVNGGLHTKISPADVAGHKFPMTVTCPAYPLGLAEAYEVLISNDNGNSWRLASSSDNITVTLGAFDSNWVLVNPNRTITQGLAVLDFGAFSATNSPSQLIVVKADGPTSTLQVGAKRASGQAAPELYGKLLVEYLGRYSNETGSGTYDASGSNSITYGHPYLSDNLLELPLAADQFGILRLSLIAYDPAKPISTVDTIQLSLDAGVTSYPLPLAPRQASKALIYSGPDIYTSDGLRVTLEPFQLARYGGVIAVPRKGITLPANSTSEVYVNNDGSLTLANTGFPVAKFVTSGSAVTDFIPTMAWLPDSTAIGVASGSVNFGQLINTDFAANAAGTYAGVALHDASNGDVLEYATSGVAWVKSNGAIGAGGGVFRNGAAGESSGAVRIGFAIQAASNGYVLTQLTSQGSGGGGGTNQDLSVSNRNATTLDVDITDGADATIPPATSTLAGLMTAADKVKLNNAAVLNASNTFTGTQIISAPVISTSGAITLDPAASNFFDITATGAINFANVSGLVVGTPYTIILRLGSNAVTWGTSFVFTSPPTLAGNCLLSFIATSSTTLWCAGYNRGY